MSSSAVSAADGLKRQGWVAIVAACSLVIILEGYDQAVYGAVVPVLIHDPSWHLSSKAAGYVGSVAVVGMMIGAIVGSAMTTRFSRRTVLYGCITVFAVFGSLCATAHSATSLGFWRLLTGIGLGGVLPVTSSLALSVIPAARRLLVYAVVFAMVPVGGLISAVVAQPVIDSSGPMTLFLLPLLPSALALAACRWAVPATPATAKTRIPGEKSATAELLGRWLPVTVCLVTATLLGLMLWYGLISWLPGIMRQAGYDLGSALTFQMFLLGGAAAGSILVAPFSDRSRQPMAFVVVLYAVGGVVLFAGLGTPPRVLLLSLIAVVGMVAQTGLIALNSAVDRLYPAHLRAHALGMTLGYGRVGAIISPSVLGYLVGGSTTSSFLLFAGCAFGAGAFALAGWTISKRPAALSSDLGGVVASAGAASDGG